MFRKIATLIGYAKAPKKTFFMKHPKKGVKALLTWKGAKKGAKTAVKSPVATAVGAALAVPLTVLAVKKLVDSA